MPKGNLNSKIVGIDLGTTNSLVAIVRDGKPQVLKARDGGHLVPSVVSFLNQSPIVGTEAKRQKVRDAQHTVFSVKRLLGKASKTSSGWGIHSLTRRSQAREWFAFVSETKLFQRSKFRR